ncbi:MAG: hypothetical protein AB8B74_05015 [Crocinitomicaceae bacterium]
MGNTAGLNDASTYDLIMGVLYGITAIVLIVTAYIIYTKQFRRQKMIASDAVKFVTAQYNIYKTKTQLLVEVPSDMDVKVSLLDCNESAVVVLLDQILPKGEHIIEFDPEEYNVGPYFFELVAPTTHVLKKIIITKN